MFSRFLGAAMILSAGVVFSACTHKPQQPVTETMTESTNADTMMVETDGLTQSADTSETTTAKDSKTVQTYQDYSPEAFVAAAGKRRVLFFHAAWCPSCRELNTELLSRAAELPSDVVVFKTNYDTESELKKKYGITYQHTLVQLNAAGETVTKWNGGGVAEILAALK